MEFERSTNSVPTLRQTAESQFRRPMTRENFTAIRHIVINSIALVAKSSLGLQVAHRRAMRLDVTLLPAALHELNDLFAGNAWRMQVPEGWPCALE